MDDVQRSRSALLVHDAPDECELIAEALAAHAFAVARSDTGEDVFEKLRRLAPDVVVVGTPPPGIDPAEVCRAAAGLSRPPVTIAAVGRADADEIARLLEAGASDFVLSRQRLDDLVARVSIRLLARRERGQGAVPVPWKQPMPEALTPGEGIRLKRRGRARARVVFLAGSLDLGNGLRSVLSTDGFTVTVRRSAQAVIADALRQVRDVVVVDSAALDRDPVGFFESLRGAGFKGQVVLTGTATSLATMRCAMSASDSAVVEIERLVAWFNEAFPATNGAKNTDSSTVDVRGIRSMLSPSDFRVFEVLLGAAGAPVSRASLIAAVRPKGELTKAALERRISRMRRKLVLFGLTIEPVSRGGYRCVRS